MLIRRPNPETPSPFPSTHFTAPSGAAHSHPTRNRDQEGQTHASPSACVRTGSTVQHLRVERQPHLPLQARLRSANHHPGGASPCSTCSRAVLGRGFIRDSSELGAEVLAACTDRSPCGSLQNRLRLHFPRYGRICCILTLLRGNITLKCIHDVTGVGGHSVTSVSSERFVTSLWVCTLCSGKHLGIPHMLVPAAQGLMSAPCLYLARAQVLCQGPWERLSLLNLGFPSLLQFSQEESQLMGTPTLKGKVLLCP
nr:uncharacterized protein LOC101788221 [Cavia porcellus]